MSGSALCRRALRPNRSVRPCRSSSTLEAALWLERVLENGRNGRPYAESFWRYILPSASVIGASVLYIMISSGGAIRDETFRVIPLIAVMPPRSLSAAHRWEADPARRADASDR